MSSTTDSTANAALVAPGARYGSVLGLFVSTSKPSIVTFGMSYATKTLIAGIVTNEPGKPPASYAKDAWAAVMAPSWVAPILTLM